MEDAVRALQQQVNALMSQNAALEAQLIGAEHRTRSCRIAWSDRGCAEPVHKHRREGCLSTREA